VIYKVTKEDIQRYLYFFHLSDLPLQNICKLVHI